ncbi:hypothetical protein Nepgr_002872 [Nepenthes gracilis]|uniref:Uncharacterized protein n=1 Tax=Nepenthes gracilis TaxID=150966 RepID=A0AAD3P7S9_NEPGR|nr:hypothetical protein Nepgr_002872 [Nepenthes gracilis]
MKGGRRLMAAQAPGRRHFARACARWLLEVTRERDVLATGALKQHSSANPGIDLCAWALNGYSMGAQAPIM